MTPGEAETAAAATRHPRSWRRAAVFGLIPAVLLAAWAFGWTRYLSLDWLISRRNDIDLLVAARPAFAFATYFAIYATATFFLVPGTLWLAIAAGLFFDLGVASGATVCAGTVGAIGVFLAARTSFGRFLADRAGPRIAALEGNFRRNQTSFMLALRLSPMVPYPIANLAPAFLGARLPVFAWTTLVGLIPSVTAYAWVGAGLKKSIAQGQAIDPYRLVVDLLPAFAALAMIALSPIAYKLLRSRRNEANLTRSAAQGDELEVAQRQDEAQTNSREMGSQMLRERFFGGIRGRLLLLTVAFVLIAEFVIYVPTAMQFRRQWFEERVQAARIAALAVDAAPNGKVPDVLSQQLLMRAQVVAVAALRPDARELVLAPSIQPHGSLLPIDLATERGPVALMHMFAHVLPPKDRLLQILAPPKMAGEPALEVIVPERALLHDFAIYSRNMLIVSLLVSAVAGLLVYLAIYRLVVRPIASITDSIVSFAQAPEAEAPRRYAADARIHEIRRAQLALETMQRQVSASFRQRKRLAELGEAMAKINHDLRNSLAAAQIISEGLAESEDPRVKRALPRLERTIERAINLAQETLVYGRAGPVAPKLQPVELDAVLIEAASEGIAGRESAATLSVEKCGLSAVADPEHVHRIIANLVRNAAHALARDAQRSAKGSIAVNAQRTPTGVLVSVTDDGPGIPERLQERLFQPFASGGRDGSGLGLAIARELARAMHGDLALARTGEHGTEFVLSLPAA